MFVAGWVTARKGIVGAWLVHNIAGTMSLYTSAVLQLAAWRFLYINYYEMNYGYPWTKKDFLIVSGLAIGVSAVTIYVTSKIVGKILNFVTHAK